MKRELHSAGQHWIVLGLGESGSQAARLLLQHGAQVTVWDGSDGTAQRKAAEALCKEGATTCLAAWPESLSFDAAVLSPGVPLNAEPVQQLRAAGIPCVSELELGWRAHRAPCIAVTGSNGKSTFVKWTADMLRAAGHSVALGGNYGPCATRLTMAEPDVDYLVLEVSSFQLESVQNFQPDVAVLLNVLPNHLDRHGTMEEYTTFKMRIFAQQEPGQVAIVPEDFPYSGDDVVHFGSSETADYIWRSGQVWFENTPCTDVSGTYFDTPVLGLAAAAQTAVAQTLHLPLSSLEQSAHEFEPLPFRTQCVGTCAGVRFINDSKATNAAALCAALSQMTQPVHLIAGGRAKEKDWSKVKEMLVHKARTVYLIGEASSSMKAAWADGVPCEECGDLNSAFNRAVFEAQSGECVLLSPGCTSFDQFENYTQRGQMFDQLVKDMSEKEIES